MADDILNQWLEKNKDKIEEAAVALGKALQPIAMEAFKPLVSKPRKKIPPMTEDQIMAEKRGMKTLFDWRGKPEYVLSNHEVESILSPGPNSTAAQPTVLIKMLNSQEYEVQGKIQAVKQVLCHNAEQLKIVGLQKKAAKPTRRYRLVIRSVHDGDTIRASLDLGVNLELTENCRLRGINAPELRSEGSAGIKARDHLQSLIDYYLDDHLTSEPEDGVYADVVEGDERDKYGRLLITLIGIQGGTENNLNQSMIDDGHSVEYKGYIQDLDFRKYEELVSLMTLDGNDQDVDTAIENAKTHQRWRVLVPLYKELNKAVQDLDLHDDIVHTLWPIRKKIREAERNVY